MISGKTVIFDKPHIPDQSTLRPYQRECLDAIEKVQEKGGSHLCVLATGLGKCFAPGTKVLMFDGSIKNVEDIKEGEQVMGPDSTPRTVIGLTHGKDTMYQVTPVKGEPYTVNSCHILSLRMTGNSGKRITAPDGTKYNSGDICNISVTDYLKASKTFKHCMKGWRTGVNFTEQKLPLDPYTFGIWLGDGTSINTNITIANNDIEIINVRGDKHIPNIYLKNSVKNRLELLAGLLDSDGFLIDNVYEICTAKEKLKNDIVFLAKSLGFFAAVSNKKVNNKIYYRIDISGDTFKIPCKVKRKQAQTRKCKKNVLNTGITVTEVGEGEYYGFELIGPDRLFLLADFTVVHNTFIFSHIPRYGRVLILSHRDELVHQPEKYYDCSFGVEQGKEHSNGEEVVSASVQSLIRRLDKFDPYDFDMIITDEAHHAVANSYKKIYEYFKPRLHLGFTATPDRTDKADLNKIYDDILYCKDIKFAIKNKFLTDIECIRVNVGYDLSKAKIRMGDFDNKDLAEAMDNPEVTHAIAEAYNKYAKGATLIFAANVKHANDISALIPGSVVVTGETKNRAEIIKDFTDRKIPCLINCMVFTEGTDMPLIETVIMARPTSSQTTYAQAVGRGLRLHPDKEFLTLVDCVGVTGRLDICTAPNLFGYGTDIIPPSQKGKLQGRLTEMEEVIKEASDNPRSWIMSAQKVSLIAKEEKANIGNVNYILLPDQSLYLSLGDNMCVRIPPTDALGYTRAYIMFNNQVLSVHQPAKFQTILDDIENYLNTYLADRRKLWDKKASENWRNAMASLKQIEFIKKLCAIAGKQYTPEYAKVTKHEAGILIERLKFEINEQRKNK